MATICVMSLETGEAGGIFLTLCILETRNWTFFNISSFFIKVNSKSFQSLIHTSMFWPCIEPALSSFHIEFFAGTGNDKKLYPQYIAESISVPIILIDAGEEQFHDL